MNLKTLRFAPLEESHISDIREIESEWNSAPWSENGFRSEITNPQSVFLVAFMDGKIVGYGGQWLLVDEAHITTIAVAKEARRHHIGLKLICELLSAAQKAGMANATLEVRAGNQGALQLYESLGFERAAVRKGYYPDNKEDAIVMWLYKLGSWKPPDTR